MLLTAIWAGLHVISAMMWLGGGILFGAFIAPALGKLSPQASGEFFVKIIPRVMRFFQIVALTTVVFGILLLYNITNGDIGSLSPTASWYGFDITFGVLFAAIAFVLSEAVSVPALGRVVRLIKELQTSGQAHPTPQLPRAIRLATWTAYSTVLLLIITLAFMVSAGFYWPSTLPPP